MSDMTAIMALQKAERLVSTIARAFYADITVLVVDTLIREKYIKDEELGSRLNLQPRQVRAALAELKEQGFAAQESMTDEIYSGRSSNYWYVDLRHAVNVIRLRVCEMQKILSQRQQAKTAQQVYVCPRCDEKFEVMDIYKLLNGDKSFCCSHCCPNDNHDECKSTSAYTLVDFHDKRGLDSVTALVKQLNEQLGKSTDPTVPRQSIFTLVHDLRDTAVPSNLPSQLRQRGMGGQQRGDVASAHARFQDDFHYRGRAADKAAAERASAAGGRGGSSKSVQLLYTKNWRGEEVVVEIEKSEDEDDDEGWGEEGGEAVLPSRSSLKRKAADARAKEEQAAKRAKKAMPTFLKGSKISGNPDGNPNAEGGDEDDSDDDDDDSSDESGTRRSTKTSVGASTAHARKLGVAAVTNVEERDERKKRLLPWTERMKQVWRQQQSELREEEQAGSGSGEEAWWEDEDGEGLNGVGRSRGAGSGGGANGFGSGMGVRFRVGRRYVSMDQVTCEEAAQMSPEEYTRFYNLAVGQRA